MSYSAHPEQLDETCRNSRRNWVALELARLRHIISRNDLFAGLFSLTLANGLISRLSPTGEVDILALIGGALSVSAVVWFACFVGLSLLWRQQESEKLKVSDVYVTLMILLLVTIPVPQLSWFALAALSGYLLSTTQSTLRLRRAAVVFFAITVPMCWGPLFLHHVAKPFLWTDAFFVSRLIGTEQIGNMVRFSDGSGYFQIFPLCSSYHNVSLAILAWISLSQFVEHKWSWNDSIWVALAAISVLAINVSRIGLIGLYREHFQTIHGLIGSTIADSLSICFILAICVWGLRRELFIS